MKKFNILIGANVTKNFANEFKKCCEERSQTISAVLKNLMYNFIVTQREKKSLETNKNEQAK